jgi:hypothetical protein
MRSGTLFLMVFAALALMAGPAGAAGRVPGSGGLLPQPNPQWEMQKRMATAEPAKSPYPMTYSEDVAQRLGLREGGVSLYDSARSSARNPYTPSVVLGGTMLRLRWRQ